MKGSFVADMWNKLAHKSRDFCPGDGVEDLQINNVIFFQFHLSAFSFLNDRCSRCLNKIF